MVDQYQSASLLAMFMIGLVGSGHCVGMCGGITTALGLAAESRRSVPLVVGYNLGRVLSYALAGAIVATLGRWGESVLALGPVLRIAAGVILVLMGLYLADWWKLLVKLEKLGAHVWTRLQPLSTRWLPITSLPRAIAVGAVWGWLPCGLVYTALVYAATSAETLDGALMMFAFGLGTAPAMLAGGLFSGAMKGFMQARPVRVMMALLLIGFGTWTTASGISHWQHAAGTENGGNHQHH